MQRRTLRMWLIIILAGMALGLNRVMPARANTQLDRLRVEYVFGQQVIFRADLESDGNVVGARFYFHRLGEPKENEVPATQDDQGNLIYEYDFMSYPLQAFSRVDYRFEVTLEGGEIVTSGPGVFYYEDDRFVWQDRKSGLFHVHWYEGDEAFGQELLDVAEKGSQQAQKLLPLVIPDERNEINIYVYASAQEMRSTMLLAGADWVAGHADPFMRLIRISIPPGPEQRTEMERQIPHELMHILLYANVGEKYNMLPSWLSEGLASVNELFPNPYYHTILTQAVAKDSLLSFNDICPNFPVDASGAYLAYAQAASFTRYLYDHFATDEMESLVATYALSTEKDCQDGTEKALGVPLSQLERDWRQSIQGGNSAPEEASSPWPWVTVLGIVLVVPSIVLVVNASRRTRQTQSAANSRKST